jgi:CDGSH-type Zn-finger protein
MMEDSKRIIKIGDKGPYIIKDGVTLVHPDGREELREGTVALCRCGLSAKKPFCDGSHKGCDTW